MLSALTASRRQRVDFTIRECAHLLHFGCFFQCRFQVWHVLIDIVVERAEIRQVVHDVGIAEYDIAENNIRRRTARQHDGLLFAPIIGGHDLPIDFDIRLLLQILKPLVLKERIPMLPQRTVSTSSVIGSLTIGRPSLLNAASASVLASSFLPPLRPARLNSRIAASMMTPASLKRCLRFAWFVPIQPFPNYYF